MSHKRNPYKEEVNFAALAQASPGFAHHLKPNGQLNFSDPSAVLALTQALLKQDFGLEIALPDDRLCPESRGWRLNYVLWLQDLLDTTGEGYRELYDSRREVVGLDIGTGASCIYPLLGCSQRPKWMFAGTDVDEKSLQYARENIARNGLETRVKLVRSEPDSPLIPLDLLGLESIDFTMCNPPFYESADEMLSLAKQKQRPPFSVHNPPSSCCPTN
ncbi:MAG: hypothetical protein M1832_004019 [Thelocarpon impressellum]|nr:MAG: hypothetical protein M1832_004019 [Thelocarpon impressellum]